MIPRLYNVPKYYDIAFNYRDIKGEVDFLENVFKTHSCKEVNSVLDIACGTCTHSIELAKKGFIIGGFDLSSEMLEYAKRKFNKSGLKAVLSRADMRGFKTDRLYDSAICMGNSLPYLLDEEEYFSHLNSVAGVLESGNVYIVDLDNPNYWFGGNFSRELNNGWIMKKGDIEVRTQLHRYPASSKNNRIHQIDVVLDVRDDKKTDRIESSHRIRVLLPEEFKDIVSKEKSFEFLECYGDFDLERKLDESKDSWRMIAVLRRG